MNILDIYLNDYSSDNIFEFLKSGFCGADIESVCMLENYCRRTNMHKSNWVNDAKWNDLIEKSGVGEAEAVKLSKLSPGRPAIRSTFISLIPDLAASS